MIYMNRLNDEEMDAVNGGTGEFRRKLMASADDMGTSMPVQSQSTSGDKKAWCGQCRKWVHYNEFSGGRRIGECGHTL